MDNMHVAFFLCIKFKDIGFKFLNLHQLVFKDYFVGSYCSYNNNNYSNNKNNNKDFVT